MAVPNKSPDLIRLLEADDKQKVRAHYHFFNRSTLRRMSLLKGCCLFLFLLFTAAYFSMGSVKRTDYANPAWAKMVQDSALQQGGDKVVLVTGAAGFVGSHVAKALKERGDGVVGIDNFNAYYPPALKRARARNLAKSGVFVVDGDINDEVLLERLFALGKFTHVLHLAAQAGVRYAAHNPHVYVQSNVNGFVTLLERCKKSNPQPAVVFASSSSVYGLNTKVPFSEVDTTDQPASLYAATKKSNEVLAHSYNHIYGLSITGLRFFTVYGPWGRPDMAYFSFTRNIMEGRPIKIFRGPHGRELARDFTFIDDIVEGCVASLDTATPSTGSGGKKQGPAQFRIFNLGNTNPVEVSTLVTILEEHLGKKAIRQVEPMPNTGDVLLTHANVTKASEELGYHPSTHLRNGLKQFVRWYTSYYKEGGAHQASMNGYKPY